MAMFISGVTSSGEFLDGEPWHVGQPLPDMAMVETLQADGDELAAINKAFTVGHSERVVEFEGETAAGIYYSLLEIYRHEDMA